MFRLAMVCSLAGAVDTRLDPMSTIVGEVMPGWDPSSSLFPKGIDLAMWLLCTVLLEIGGLMSG